MRMDERERMAKSAAETMGKNVRKNLEENTTPEELAAIDEYVKKNGPIEIRLPFLEQYKKEE